MKLGRMAEKMAKRMDDKKPRKRKEVIADNRIVQSRAENPSGYHNTNHIEHRIAQALDHKEELKRYAKLLEKLANTKDVNGFFQDIAPETAAAMLLQMTNPNTPAKVRAEISKDILDRAGYGKVTKHAVARFDASASKEEIISRIIGSKKDLGKVGIEITDDDNEESESQQEGSGESSEG